MNERGIGRRIESEVDEVKRSVRKASGWLVAFGRFGYVAKGVVFVLIGVLTAYSAVSSKAADDGARSALEHVADVPFGQFLLVAVAVGLYQFYQVYSAKFREKLLLREMSENEVRWAVRFGRAGYAARGFIFGVIGFFLGLAAYQADAGDVRDFGGALRTIEQQPYGAWLIGLVAVGFIGYGLFMLILAKYRRIVIA